MKLKLKLQLLKDNKIVFEMPLSTDEWQRKRLEHELDSFEQDLGRFSRLFDALSHETRLRMMTRLFEHDEQALGFADFMRDLDLNPKTVWESTRKLRAGGLLTKSRDGKYRCSDPAAAEFLMVSLALRRLLNAIEEL
jgi:DNA-binding transcriptional ArsR family regulator